MLWSPKTSLNFLLTFDYIQLFRTLSTFNLKAEDCEGQLRIHNYRGRQ